MGSIGISNGPRLGAFQSEIFATGLDLGRSVITQDGGFYKASSGAAFRAGQLVAQDATGEIVLCTGADCLGVAKWNKVSLGESLNVDEALVLNGTTASNLLRANVSGVSVRSATDFGGTLYTEGGGNDYILNTTNGTIARDGASSIPDGGTVYVTYHYALTSQDYDFQGRNFFNFVDDVSVAEGRITVVTDWAVLFTTEWDSDSDTAYALTGAASQLRCSPTGQFTNDSGVATAIIGKVFQLPNADDPYMGIQLRGGPHD